MQPLNELEIGVMFWAGGDPLETLREVKGLGVRCGQLGVPGDMDFNGAAEAWKAALRAEEFTVVTVFAAYAGEDYADMPTVRNTVGFIPPATREEREERTYAVSDFAAGIGAPGIATHIGFVPEDTAAGDYREMLKLVRRVCDHAARNGQTFALETGQEPADVLLGFIRDVDRHNLHINFDPANMILYGTGDPIEALRKLSEYVITVHCKDGDWPPEGVAGALGTERPLGAGSVGIPRFIETLKALRYEGTLNVERETSDPQQRLADIAAAVKLLEGLR